MRGRPCALMLAALAMRPSPSPAETPPVHTVMLRSEAEAVEAPLVLGFDRRLTIVAPRPIRLAVPGSPDVIGVTVKDRVAVVTLVDSPFVRRERPGTNLTLVLDDGGAIALRLVIAGLSADVSTDLVHLEAPPEAVGRVHTEALRLLTRWAAGEAVPPEAARALEPARERLDARVDAHVLTRIARQAPATWDRRARDQRRFIYLAGDRALRLGDRCLLRLMLSNRSQPAFVVGRVEVAAPGTTGDDDARPPFFAPDPVVLPDERPRPLAIDLPGPACTAALEVEICEAPPGERCVTLSLPAP